MLIVHSFNLPVSNYIPSVDGKFRYMTAVFPAAGMISKAIGTPTIAYNFFISTARTEIM
jgi:hypothetical protein